MRYKRSKNGHDFWPTVYHAGCPLPEGPQLKSQGNFRVPQLKSQGNFRFKMFPSIPSHVCKQIQVISEFIIFWPIQKFFEGVIFLINELLLNTFFVLQRVGLALVIQYFGTTQAEQVCPCIPNFMRLSLKTSEISQSKDAIF